MVNIDYFRNFVLAVQNKTQSGNSITPEQQNIFFNQAQLAQFEFDRNIFITTGEITKYLTFFMKNSVKQVPPLTGYLPYPTDWEHTIKIRRYYLRKVFDPTTNTSKTEGIWINVDEVKDVSWGDIQISSLLKASPRFSKYMEFANEFRFLPKTIGSVEIDYLATPIKPVWAYTKVNGRPVYDPVNSVNFQWEDFSLNNIAMQYLQLIGCNLSMPQLNAFATQFKANSSAPL